MFRSALLTTSLTVLLAASAQAGSVAQPAMTPMPGAGSAASMAKQVGLRRCQVGAVQCMGGFVQRCVERWGDTMWMTNGQRCSG